jgi:hypothetical protein
VTVQGGPADPIVSLIAYTKCAFFVPFSQSFAADMPRRHPRAATQVSELRQTLAEVGGRVGGGGGGGAS